MLPSTVNCAMIQSATPLLTVFSYFRKVSRETSGGVKCDLLESVHSGFMKKSLMPSMRVGAFLARDIREDQTSRFAQCALKLRIGLTVP